MPGVAINACRNASCDVPVAAMMRARPEAAIAPWIRDAASAAAAPASARPSENVCTRIQRASYLTWQPRRTTLIYWRAMSIDLLVFGPHPDDIEIGLGGTVARHAAAGDHVGLCDLTEGELSSNGTVEVRRQEAAAAARVLGAAFRENLRWPDGGIETTPPLIRSAVDVIRHH